MEKSTKKRKYQEFFPQLIDAYSDDQIHNSVVSVLYSRSLITEEEKTQLLMSSIRAGASSLLMPLGVEEKPRLLTERILAEMRVEKLQALAEEMSIQLRKSKQGETFCKTLVYQDPLYR